MIRQEVGNRQGGLTLIVSGSGVADNAFRMRDLLGLTDEQRQMRDLVRVVARERIAPLAAQVDETETYPVDQLTWLGEQGLMGPYLPETYGGTDLGALAFCLGVEARPWACAAGAVTASPHSWSSRRFPGSPSASSSARWGFAAPRRSRST